MNTYFRFSDTGITKWSNIVAQAAIEWAGYAKVNEHKTNKLFRCNNQLFIPKIGISYYTELEDKGEFQRKLLKSLDKDTHACSWFPYSLSLPKVSRSVATSEERSWMGLIPKAPWMWQSAPCCTKNKATITLGGTESLPIRSKSFWTCRDKYLPMTEFCNP